MVLHGGKEDFLRVRDVSNIWDTPCDGGYSDWLNGSERKKEFPFIWRTAELEVWWEERQKRWDRKLWSK